MAVVRLTERKLRSVQPKGEREDFWDSDLDSFGVRVSEGGTRTFYVRYRIGTIAGCFRIELL